MAVASIEEKLVADSAPSCVDVKPPICVSVNSPKSPVERPRSSVAVSPPYAAASSLFELANIQTVYLKLTPRSFIESRKGQATPESFFPLLVSKFGAQRLAWGSNYPSSEGSLPELKALATNALATLPQSDQDWIFAKTAQTLYPALAK